MGDETRYEQVYRRAIPSVVSVYVTAHGSARSGAGSGFVYDDAHVVTNHHVVGSADEVELRFSDGVSASDPRERADGSSELRSDGDWRTARAASGCGDRSAGPAG